MSDDESKGTPPSPESVITPNVEVVIQRHVNEVRSEILDQRASALNRILAVITIFLAIGGFAGFTIFNKLEIDARKSIERLEKMVVTAGEKVKSISKAEEAVKRLKEERDKKPKELSEGVNLDVFPTEGTH